MVRGEGMSNAISRRCFVKSALLGVLSFPAVVNVCVGEIPDSSSPHEEAFAVPECPDDIHIGSEDYPRIGHMCEHIF